MGLTKNIVTTHNVYKICRICLEDKPDSLPMSENIIISDDMHCSLQEILSRLKSSNIEDERLPQLICLECVKLLEAAYVFQLKYDKSLTKLHKYLENLKQEPEDNNKVNECDTKYPPPITTPSAKKNIKRTGGKRVSPPMRDKLKDNIVEVPGTTEAKEDMLDDPKDAAVKLLHPCPICTHEYSAPDLRKHVHSHKALTKYLTIPNSKKLHRKTKFIAKRDYTNTVSIFNKTGEKHKCPYCDKFFDIEKFRVHIELHRHQEEYRCEECGRVFRKLNHLNTHRVKHLKEYPFKCEQCDKGFVIKTNYDCHMLTHTNTELPHECRYCMKRFSNPEHLNRHLVIHTENVTYSVKYKVCKCYHCLKTFKDKDELQRHTCIPVEQVSNTLYPCKMCNKVFKHHSGLYNHTRNIHKLKGAKTLCSVCGHYVSNIYNHMMRHNGQRSYACTECEKSFFTKPQLRQHLLVHSGVKPFVCSICAKAFNNLYNLQVHERIHKGDRCHICNVCNKGFLEKSYLKKHMHVHKK